MKKAKEQLKIRKGNQLPTEMKSKAEEVRLASVRAACDGGPQFCVFKNTARHACLATLSGISLPHRRFFFKAE